MLINAKMADTHIGRKSIENSNMIEAKIRNNIFLFYLEASFPARPV